MAQNRTLNIQPIALTGTLATTILKAFITTLTGGAGYTQTQPYILVTHMRIVNTTSGPLAVSLFVGAAATASAGTEFAFSATVVPANSYVDWYGKLRLDGSTAFEALCGGSTTTGLTINIDAEMGVSG